MHLIIASLLVIFSLPSAAATLLVLGDSISAGYGMDVEKGWVQLLANELEPEHKVVNGSISGDTTAGGVYRLPTLLEEYQPDIVIIELGGNDGLRGYPLTRMKTNLINMIEQTRKAGAEPMLLGILIPPNYGERYADSFANTYVEVAEQTDTLLVPLIEKALLGRKELIQGDGIHPNETAQPMLMAKVTEGIDKLTSYQAHLPSISK